MSSLPQISYNMLCKLLRDFSLETSGIGSPQIHGRNRNGTPYSVRAHPHHDIRPDVLQRILHYLDVSRKEFDDWRR